MGKNEQVKIHANLPPGERINLIFEEYIAPALSIEGFKYNKSRSNFKRDVGSFRQEIYIAKDKWNRGDVNCAFWLILFVYAKNYNKWHLHHYNKLPVNDIVFSEYHYHLDNWRSKFGEDKYDFSVQNNSEVITEIIINLKQILSLFYRNTLIMKMRRIRYCYLSRMDLYQKFLIFIPLPVKNKKLKNPWKLLNHI